MKKTGDERIYCHSGFQLESMSVNINEDSLNPLRRDSEPEGTSKGSRLFMVYLIWRRNVLAILSRTFIAATHSRCKRNLIIIIRFKAYSIYQRPCSISIFINNCTKIVRFIGLTLYEECCMVSLIVFVQIKLWKTFTISFTINTRV